MKTAIYPIEQNLTDSIQHYLAQLVLDHGGEKNGDKVFVGCIRRQAGVKRNELLKNWENAFCNAFVTTVTQDRRDEMSVREFFSMYMQAVDVNWHADELKLDHNSDNFPLYVCIRHTRSTAKPTSEFVISFFISMDSTTMEVEVENDKIKVKRDEIYDDLDVFTMRYVYQP